LTSIVIVKFLHKWLMLCSTGLGNSYFRVGSRGARRIPEFPTWKYDFRLQWNDISHWENRKCEFPSPMERSINPIVLCAWFVVYFFTFGRRSDYAVISDYLYIYSLESVSTSTCAHCSRIILTVNQQRTYR